MNEDHHKRKATMIKNISIPGDLVLAILRNMGVSSGEVSL
jgi:hypothetical protein